ncbi:unnamed protein product, partial [Rotaria sordida]
IYYDKIDNNLEENIDLASIMSLFVLDCY